MNAPGPATGQSDGGVSDDELLSRWLDERYDDAGATSVAVFIRHREAVRMELESVGLAPLEAVQRVETVFHLAQGERPDIPSDTPLRERLLIVAREVGSDANWSPPL